MARSSTGIGVAYRALAAPWDEALSLFDFAGAWAPSPEQVALGWGAWEADRLCGALLAERSAGSAMLHGPVVVAAPDVALGVADQLVSDALAAMPGHKIDTVYTRPQGLDRIWVRSGFIPIPEAELPAALRGRPGLGLFGWRGGTALWSSAGRNAVPARSAPAARSRSRR